jgi:hypothetical protein
VVVVLIFFGGFVVAITIVQFKSVGGIWEWRCRVVCETLEIVDNLDVQSVVWSLVRPLSAHTS